MIAKTMLRTCRTILVILLMELARVTNFKPNLEARSTINEDYQASDPEQDSKVLVELSTERAKSTINEDYQASDPVKI